MKLTIRNTFHNSNANVIIKTDSVELSASQVKRVEKKLCGMNCSCGSMWSHNHTEIEGYENCHFEPIMDNFTGKITGAYLVKD